MNQGDINEALEDVLGAIEGLIAEVRDAGEKSARAEATYKTEYSKSRLTIRATAFGKMTVDQVGDEATVQCEEIYLQHLIAENHLLSVRESSRLTQTKCDVLRTLSTSFRNAGG